MAKEDLMVAYLCDGMVLKHKDRDCGWRSETGQCRHTFNPAHKRNNVEPETYPERFEEIGGVLWEKMEGKNEREMEGTAGVS